MPRQPQIQVDDAGAARLRIRFPARTWQVISAYAARIDVAPEVAARIFIEQIDGLITAGSVAWLSADWQSAARGVKQAPQIDFTKLHRSDRTKSGYVGIYANGAGFRAVGRAGAYVGTYQTAEIAAWERYVHYQRNGLPYGELELAVDDLRKQGEPGTDQELMVIAIETARQTGTAHLMAGFGPGGLEAASAALEEHDEKADKPTPSSGRSLTRKP